MTHSRGSGPEGSDTTGAGHEAGARLASGGTVDPHALEVLEFHRALERVAERTGSALGRAAILALRPSTDASAIRRELDRVRAMIDFVDEDPGWAPPTAPDARTPLRRLGVEGSVLEASELHLLHRLLHASRVLAAAMDERAELDPALAFVRERLVEDEGLERELERSVDAGGEVLDTASKELRRIRASLRTAHSRIVKQLEAYMGTLPDRFVVGDASVTVREGRYVIPLRREGKGEVGGIVHDESGTGATIFVEPPIAVALMNELRDLERDESREIQRILRELTGRARPLRPSLGGALEALVDVDSLHARARAALAWRATPPEVLDPDSGTLRLVGARHPLLIDREERVVPYDLEMGEGERTLVVSGPNTGGKSVFLKAVGLLAALTQSGIVPPVGKGTALPVFGGLFADIGDEQSIAESLSTFSAHLANLKTIVTAADRHSLVLIDEMGTGTDPTEGAALARALLETLTARGALSIVTSHLGQLKTLDEEGSGIVNASLEFDSARMEPTYHLVKGRPGRSYGLAIARRLGFPSEVLDRAQVHVDEGAASLEELLERLERREREAETLRDRLSRETAEAERLRAEVESREKRVAEREREFERQARDDARKLLMDARDEVEEAIREVRTAGETELAEAARRARRKVEEAAREQVEKKPDRRPGTARTVDVEEGARVRLPGTAATRGTVVEIRDGRAMVDVGGIRMEVAAAELEPVEGEGEARPETRSRVSERGWSGELPAAKHEIDLRGLRVDEVDLELGRALDAALLGDLHEVRIIHGKGTGAVRSRVQELLSTDRRVTDYRLGVAGEGGAGVTVARLER